MKNTIFVMLTVIAFLAGSLFPIASTMAGGARTAPDVNCHGNYGAWAVTAVWENGPLPEVQISGPVGTEEDKLVSITCGRQDGISRMAFIFKPQGATYASVRWYSGVSFGEFFEEVIDTGK
jgi:hypothetical protein